MQGRMDSPLTALGIEAAMKLSEVFPPFGKENCAPTQSVPTVGKVYCSPSGRTLQTANILFSGQNIVCEDRLLEINMGSWEGRLQSELDVEEPALHACFWDAPQHYSKEGAENVAQVTERAVEFFQEIAERHQGETIAVVSHTVVIRSILFLIEPRDLCDFWKPPAVYPASVSEVELIDGVARIVRFGCTAHHDHNHSGAY